MLNCLREHGVIFIFIFYMIRFFWYDIFNDLWFMVYGSWFNGFKLIVQPKNYVPGPNSLLGTFRMIIIIFFTEVNSGRLVIVGSNYGESDGRIEIIAS